jgi:hypothetical protein
VNLLLVTSENRRRYRASRWLKGAIVTLVVTLMGMNGPRDAQRGSLQQKFPDALDAVRAEFRRHEDEAVKSFAQPPVIDVTPALPSPRLALVAA